MNIIKYIKNKNADPLPEEFKKMWDVGFHFRGQSYLTYTKLNIYESAFFRLNARQKSILLIILSTIVISLLTVWHTAILLVIFLLTTIYFVDILFNLFLIFRSFTAGNSDSADFADSAGIDWPIYTILCPLYKEWHVLPQFINSICNLDYPKERLQVLLLLEEDDEETFARVSQIKLPEFIQIAIIPHSMPKTKPKACNYGLALVQGKYCVIYDAEDVPEKDQLKKAVLAFEKLSDNVICQQAKLNFYNPYQNILTRLFCAEYSLWFDLILPGLQSINAPIPLGGTSNHFRTSILKELQGWDPFNVTEDCDLGIRLAKKGYTTTILDSTTYEEANSEIKNWFWQRSRWIKGYIQTYLVHTRCLKDFQTKDKYWNIFTFQLTVGGKILSMFINPLMWFITFCYFAKRAEYGLFIESFFPAPVLYMAVFSVIIGNFLYFYYYMVGLARRGYFDLIKFGFLVPVYWIFMSFAAWIALYKLLTAPFQWSKTKHGLHLPVVQNTNVYVQNHS